MKKIHLIIPAFFILVAGIYFLLKVYDNVEAQNDGRIYNEKVIFARQASRGIESFFEYYQNSLIYLSGIDHIVNLDEKGKTELKKFYESHKSQITAVTRVSAEGKLLYTYPESPESIGADLSKQEHNRYLLLNRRPVTSDVFTLVQGYKGIVSTYPVFQNDKFEGGLAVAVPFSFIARNYLDKSIIGDDMETFVINKNGNIIYSGDEKNIGENYKNVPELKNNYDDLVEKMISGESGVLSFSDTLAGNDNLSLKHAVYYPVDLGNTFWSVAVITSESDTYALMTEFRENYIYVVLITTLFFTLFVGTFFIYDRKYNARVRQTREDYRILTEKTGQIFFRYNRNNKELFLLGGCEEITGYSNSELQQLQIKLWRTNIHPEDRDILRQISRKYKELAGNFLAEFRFMHKKGYYIYLEMNGISFFEKNNKRSMFLGVIKNITERKLLEAELKNHSEELERIVKLRTAALINLTERLKEDIKRRQDVENELINAKERAEISDKLKSEFLAQISHEIRTPINTIINYVSLIKMESDPYLSDEVKSGFQSIDNAASRLLRTIDLVLDMSDVEAGSYEPDLKELSLEPDVFDPLKAEFEQKARKKGLSFFIDSNDEIKDTKLISDKYTVTQIFANLIDNALKYTKEGFVKVVLRKDNELVIVEVVDSGIGIKEEFIPHLFDKFTQEEQGYTRKFEGNGLGLALVKKYCEINNAIIEVSSVKGKGSTFRVIFRHEIK